MSNCFQQKPLVILVMKRFFKYFFLFLAATILLLSAGFFIPRKGSFGNACPEDSVSIVIGSNGYHTSFILPVKHPSFDWSLEFPVPYDIKYIEFGWGNQQFYMSKDFSIKATLRALFPSATVMHVVYLDKDPEKWFKGSKGKRIHLCTDDYLALIRYIKKSFDLDERQHPVYLGEGLYGPSYFFKGKGSYHALETCNTWVARGLREANVRTPLWGGLAPAIMWHLKNVK